MADDAFDFEINIKGGATSALGALGAQLGATSEGLKKGGKDVELFEGEIGKLSGEVLGLGVNLGNLSKGGSIFTFDLSRMVAGAAEAVTSVIEKVADLGKEFITAAASAQDLNLAIGLDVGNETFNKIEALGDSFERTSRFSGEQIKTAMLPLLEAGMSDTQQLDDLATAATDIAARRKQGIEGVNGALEAFQKIQLKGEVDKRALRALAINEQSYFTDLGGLLGVSAASAEKLTKEHKVKNATLLSVALNQVAQREGGELGTATKEAAATLGGTLERLSHVKESAFVQLANSPGIKSIQSVMDNFIDIMSGPIGHDLVNQIGDSFNSLVTAIFGDLSGKDGLQKMETGIGKLTDAARDFAADLRGDIPAIKEDLKGLASVASGIADSFRAIGNFADDVKDVSKFIGGTVTNTLSDAADFFSGGATDEHSQGGGFLKGSIEDIHGTDYSHGLGRDEAAGILAGHEGELGDRQSAWDADDATVIAEATAKLRAKGIAVGGAYAEGFAIGLAQGQPAVAAASTALASTPGDVTCDVNQIHSPSALARGYGGDYTDGLAMGLDDGRGDVSAAARRASTLDAPDTTSSSGGGSATLSIGELHVHVESRGHEGAEQQGRMAAQAARMAAQAARAEFVALFGELGWTLGRSS